MSGTDSFDPVRALRALSDAGVAFVLIGGVAGRLHGSPTVTRDIDICHERGQENLERLAGALRELRAHLRGVEEDVPFLLDARTLRAAGNFTFTTDAGDVDILAMPAGVDGYDELARTAVTFDIDGIPVLVATLDDLIRMKTAAARQKDLIEVEVLSALRDEIAHDS